MTYLGKELADYTDAELLAIARKITDMDIDDTTKRNTPEYKRKWGNRPAPAPNPAFVELKNALALELKVRNKNNGNS